MEHQASFKLNTTCNEIEIKIHECDETLIKNIDFKEVADNVQEYIAHFKKLEKLKFTFYKNDFDLPENFSECIEKLKFDSCEITLEFVFNKYDPKSKDLKIYK